MSQKGGGGQLPVSFNPGAPSSPASRIHPAPSSPGLTPPPSPRLRPLTGHNLEWCRNWYKGTLHKTTNLFLPLPDLATIHSRFEAPSLESNESLRGTPVDSDLNKYLVQHTSF